MGNSPMPMKTATVKASPATGFEIFTFCIRARGLSGFEKHQRSHDTSNTHQDSLVSSVFGSSLSFVRRTFSLISLSVSCIINHVLGIDSSISTDIESPPCGAMRLVAWGSILPTRSAPIRRELAAAAGSKIRRSKLGDYVLFLLIAL